MYSPETITEVKHVLGQMKVAKGKRMALETNRNQYRNFLWACWSELPSVGAFALCPSEYQPGGLTN